uniref:PNPLA domain-containing protein n=1 Tax=Vitrella brassicaformis TaxID=1169539 RepID=A0A7S1JSM4_9ALVE|mmetsp:Transcript_22398/g.55216  ORF Transcript_22398/g.55216 Transcript_22398/m.55216 type:complete len:575 (+) Transcript_22398:82-1806(+)
MRWFAAAVTVLIQGSLVIRPASGGGLQTRLRGPHRAVKGTLSMQMAPGPASVDPLLPPNALKRPWCWSLERERKRTILALDGGGVRGIVAACVLEVLEDELRNQTGIDNLTIGECFDVVAGTSTGAILATYLTSYACRNSTARLFPGTEVVLDGTAKSALSMYEQMARKIFPKTMLRSVRRPWLLVGPKHAADGLEKALTAAMHPNCSNLQDFINVVPKRGDWLGPTLFITAYDMVFRRPVAFVGDRLRRNPDFMRLDHFTFPYQDRSLARSVPDRRWKQLALRFQQLKNDSNITDVFPDGDSLTRLGDAELPLGSRKNQTETARYWRTNPEVELWEICRCSSAAPTFFKPARIRKFFRWPPSPLKEQNARDLVACDGGIVANDPAMQAWNYLYTRGKLIEHVLAKYVGSGMRIEDMEAEEVPFPQPLLDYLLDHKDFFTNLRLEDHAILSIGVGAAFREQGAEEAARIQSAVDWLGGANGNIIDSLMTSSSTLAHFNLDAAFSNEGVPEQYLRVQCSADKNEGSVGYAPPHVFAALERMDDPSGIPALKKIGKALAELYRPLIADFVDRYLII